MGSAVKLHQIDMIFRKQKQALECSPRISIEIALGGRRLLKVDIIVSQNILPIILYANLIQVEPNMLRKGMTLELVHKLKEFEDLILFHFLSWLSFQFDQGPDGHQVLLCLQEIDVSL